jgi:hypothetical protein
MTYGEEKEPLQTLLKLSCMLERHVHHPDAQYQIALIHSELTIHYVTMILSRTCSVYYREYILVILRGEVVQKGDISGWEINISVVSNLVDMPKRYDMRSVRHLNWNDH